MTVNQAIIKQYGEEIDDFIEAEGESIFGWHLEDPDTGEIISKDELTESKMITIYKEAQDEDTIII
jgi:hypothetical protein